MRSNPASRFPRRRLVRLLVVGLLLAAVLPGGWAVRRYRSNAELNRLLDRARYGGSLLTHNLDDDVYQRLVVLSDTRFGPLPAIGDRLREVWWLLGDPKSIKIAGPGCPPAQILPRLAGMSRLERINIYACGEIGDELRHVAECEGLTGLTLSRMSLRPKGAGWIANCERLEELDLSLSAGVDAAAVAELADLKRLRVLRISGTGVTDAGIERLAKLRGLEDLRVSGTALTDASVPVLTRIGPKRLDVSGTGLTAEGVGRLRASLPGTDVRASF